MLSCYQLVHLSSQLITRNSCFTISQVSHTFDKTVVLSAIWDNCASNDKKMFKEEETIETLETFGLMNDMNKS